MVLWTPGWLHPAKVSINNAAKAGLNKYQRPFLSFTNHRLAMALAFIN